MKNELDTAKTTESVVSLEQEIVAIVSGVRHPESGKTISEEGFTQSISTKGDTLYIYITPKRKRDPMAKSITREVERLVVEHLEKIEAPSRNFAIRVTLKEPTSAEQGVQQSTTQGATQGTDHGSQQNSTHGSQQNPQQRSPKSKIGEGAPYKIVAIASGKGGVGKSTVTAAMALTLHSMGYRVGILDGDIYGPSQHKIFGLEGVAPEVESHSGHDMILPPVSHGIKVISMGMFVGENNALMWRGVMASSALTQLARDTAWGDLDYLLIDLPPGTGDIHLSLATELALAGAVIVSTPQNIALADVRRGVEMLRNEKVQTPILGIVENMSYFTPPDLPDRKYYIFGQGAVEKYADQRCNIWSGGC